VEWLNWSAVGGSVAVAAGNGTVVTDGDGAVDVGEFDGDGEGEVEEVFARDVRWSSFGRDSWEGVCSMKGGKPRNEVV
jgi:hypothetical protein